MGGGDVGVLDIAIPTSLKEADVHNTAGYASPCSRR